MNALSRRVLGVKGEVYHFNNSISNTFGGTFIFEELILNFSNSSSGGTLLELTAPLVWDNVTVIGNNLTTGILLKSNSTESTLNNCTLKNGANRTSVEFDLCTNLRLYRVEFEYVDVTLKGGNVSECVFSRCDLVIKRDFVINSGENIPLDVLNNEFKLFNITDAEQSKIEFRGSAANTSFYWITVKNNFWTGDTQGGAGYVTYVIFETNANDQDNRVDVYNNSDSLDASFSNAGNHVKIPTTRFIERVTTSGTSGTETIALDPAMLILTGRDDVPVYTQSSFSLDVAASNWSAMNFQGTFPNVQYFWNQSGGSFAELYVEFFTSVRQFDLSFGGHI